MILTIITLITALSLSPSATSVTGQITYVSDQTVYVNLGSDNNIQPGDSGMVYHNDLPIASLIAKFVARKSAACEYFPSNAVLNLGDQVIFDPQNPQTEPEKTTVLDTNKTSSQPPITVRELTTSTQVKRIAKNRFTGSLYFQYFSQLSNNHRDNDFHQFSERLTFRLQNIENSSMSLTFNMRTRQIDRNNYPQSLIEDNRFYELNLKYDHPHSKWGYNLGRMSVYGIAGVGRIDGGLISYKYNTKWNFGLFTGWDSPYDKAFASDKLKIGAFTNLTLGEWNKKRFNFGLSLVSITENGNIDRDFLVLQTSYYNSNIWNINTNAELNIHREWRYDLYGNYFSLSYFNANGQLKISDFLNFTSGYSFNINVRNHLNRDIPDSLYDHCA